MKRALLLLALAAAGCGSTTGAPPTTTSRPVPVSPPPMTVTIFHADQPSTVRVPRSRAVAAAALHALGIDAPVTISNGTATVALPDATASQVKSIVWTLTQFASVQRVDVGGRTGLTRTNLSDGEAPIIVGSPTSGASVSASFAVSGSASVFEATLVVELDQGGRSVDKQTVTASEGAPGRGTFSATLHGTAGPATIRAYAPSAADGAPQHEVDVPVTISP